MSEQACWNMKIPSHPVTSATPTHVNKDNTKGDAQPSPAQTTDPQTHELSQCLLLFYTLVALDQ